MQNDLVRKAYPPVLGNNLHQVALDFDGVGFSGEIEPQRNALHMRIDDDAGGDAVGRPEHDIGGLARRAGHGEKLLHGARDLAAEIVDDPPGCADNRLRFVIEESGAADVLRQHLGRYRREVLGRWIFREQAGSDFVDALVGALCGENRRDQQLPWVPMMQRAGRVGVHTVEAPQNLLNARFTLGGGFRFYDGSGFWRGFRGRAGDCGFGLRQRTGFHVSWNLETRSRLTLDRLLLFTAAVLPFCGSLLSGFHFDDYAIFQDASIRSPGGWLAVWGLRQTRPLTYLTFWVNYQLGGENGFGYHALNLALHAAAVLLLFNLLRRIAPEQAMAAALIFAVHPLQSEPVDYVWARSIVLCAIFVFAAWGDWSAGRQWRAVAWFALALLAKEECAAFPLALALMPRPPKERARRLAALAAMFGLSGLAAARVFYVLSVTGAPAGAHAGVSAWHYFLAQGTVIWRYLLLFVVPGSMTVDPAIAIPPAWLGLIAWAALAAVAVLAWRAGFRWFAVGLILLLPSSSIFPAEDLAANRRMYLALAAFAVALVEAAERVFPWVSVKIARAFGTRAGRRPTPLAAAYLIFAACASVASTYIWSSDERLWQKAVEGAPDKVRPRVQLARNLPPAEALAQLERAREMAPNDPNVAAETGKTLLLAGNAAAALGEFGRALALDPRDARNYNNRGVALMALGQGDAARQDFERALRMDPSLSEARSNLDRLAK